MAVSEADVEALLSDAPPAETTEDEVRALLGEADGDATAQVGQALRTPDPLQPERRAAVLELARKVGVSADLAEKSFDELTSAWKSANEDPEKFRAENPHIAAQMLRNPAATKVLTSEPVSGLTKYLRGIVQSLADAAEREDAEMKARGKVSLLDTLLNPLGTEKKVFEAGQAMRGEQAKRAAADAATPKEFTVEVAPEASASGFTRPFVIAKAEFQHKLQQNELANANWAMMQRIARGEDTWDLEKKLADLELQGGQRYYNQSPVEQVILEAAGIAPSIVTSTAGYLAGAALGYGGAALARKPQAGPAAAKVLSRIGGGAVSFYQEAGLAFSEMRKQKTDDGKPVSNEVAMGAALLYGAAAAAVDVGAFNIQLDALGPLGEALKTGSKESFVKAAVKNPSFMALARKAGLAHLKGAAAEGGQEFVQSLAQEFAAWGGRQATAGTSAWESVDVQGALNGAVAEASAAFTGSLLLGAPKAGLNITSEVVLQKRAKRAEQVSARQVAGIVEAAKERVVKAMPKEVAELIEAETADSGEPVTAMHVDPEAFTKFYQDQNIDPAKGAAELMGDEGPALLEQATATGQLMEVPMAVFVERWGGLPIAEALLPDMTTRPGLRTQRQVEVAAKETEKQAEQIVTDYDGDKPTASAPAFDQAMSDLYAHLIEAKDGTKKEVAAKVTLVRQAIATQAARSGRSADDIAREFVPRVVRQYSAADPGTEGEPGASGGTPTGGTEAGGEAVAAQSAAPDAPASPARALPPRVFEDVASGTVDLPAAEAAISRMKSAKKAEAQAWLDYYLERTTERPKVSPDMQRRMALYGVVDPVHGFTFDESGRDRSASTKQRKKRGPRGEEPAELRRARLERNMSAEDWQKAGYRDFYQGPNRRFESVEEIIAEQDRKRAHIDAIKAGGPRPLQFAMRYGGKLMVSKDPSKPGQWRVTRFEDADGTVEPTGHTDAKTFEAAIDEASHYSNLGYAPARILYQDPKAAPASISQQLSDRALNPKHDRATELFLDSVSGLRTREAFERTPVPEGKSIGIITSPDVKGINDSEVGGHDTSNELLRVIGAAIGDGRPEAARGGTNFFVHVADQAELKKLIQKAKKALPHAKLDLAGTVVPSLDDAGFKAFDDEVDKQRKRARGKLHRDVKVDALEFGKGRGAGVVPDELVSEAASLSPSDFFARAYLSKKLPGTGALSAAGWRAIPRKAFAASLDLRRLKAVNQAHGAAKGDEMLMLFALAAQRAGGPGMDFTHMSGDEFALQADSQEDVESFLADLRGELAEVGLEVTLADGKPGRLPVSFRDGIGKTYGLADRDLNRKKRAEGADAGGSGSAEAGGHPGSAGGVVPGPADLAGRRARAERRGVEPPVFGDRRGDRQERVAQTETQPFKSWFGKSKVVDAQGKPLRVFHGTNYAGFDSFAKEFQAKGGLKGPGFYFTEDPAVASEYSDKTSDTVGEKLEKPAVYPVFLSLQNPFDEYADAKSLIPQLMKFSAKPPPSDVRRMIDSALRDENENFSVEGIGAWVDNTEWAYNIADRAGKNGEELLAPHFDYILAKARDHIVRQIRAGEMTTGKDVLELIEKNVMDMHHADNRNIRQVLEAFGYDGITHEGGGLMGGGKVMHRVWIAFEPQQVKSATGNSGAFDPNDPSILRQEDDDGPRGFVEMTRTGLRRIFNVVLTEKADRSTFLHESGHVFLEMLGDLAEAPDANDAIKQELATVLSWLGVEDRASIQREHHEKWARAFEAYLMEGKAPSKKLEAAFGRFKEWLKQVYKSIASLNVEMDDSIRGVFDRLLATDEEIARGTERMGLQPIFRSPEEAGMTPEQWQAYLDDQERATSTAQRRVELRLLKDKLREAEKEWKAEEAKALEEARGQYDALPAVKAREYLREGFPPIELDEEAVVEAIGKEGLVAERLKPAADRSFNTVNGGTHPDEVAEVNGFASGREMLEAIQSIPARDAWTKERARELMEEQHPDIFNDRARLREEVDKGLHGGTSAQWLLREWKALRSKAAAAGEALADPPVEAIKRAAALLVERQVVRELHASRALQAERSAAERAAAAAARGNWPQAYIHKQQQLLNHFLFRELTDAREERASFEELLGDMADKKRRAKLGLAGGPYLDVADAVTEALGMKEPDPDAERAGLPELLKHMEAEDMAPAFAPQLLAKVIGEAKAWKDLTVEEMRNTARALKQLKKLATDANNVALEGKRVAIGELAATIQKEALENGDKGPLPAAEEGGASKWWATSRWVQGAMAGLTRPELMLERLGATAHKFFFDGYLQARNAENALAKKVLAFFDEKWGALPEAMQKRRFDQVEAAELPFPADVNRDGPRTRQWMWMVALNMGNESNKERLLGGYDWNERTVLDWLNKHMTKEEWTFVQGVWDLLDQELYPHVSETFQAINGLAPDKIKPTSIETPHGTFRGGYFPARYDPIASRLGRKQDESAVAKLFSPSSTRASVAKSFTKERAKNYTDVVSLQWGHVPLHVASTIHYATHERFVRDAARVMTHANVSMGIQRGLGEKYETQLLSWLKAVASSQTDSAPAELMEHLDLMGALRSRFVMSTIGASMTVAMGDMTNPLVAIADGEVKARYVIPAYASAMAKFGGDLLLRTATLGRRSLDVQSDPASRSEELRHRAESSTRRLKMEMGEIGKKKGKLEPVREAAWWAMEFTDRLTSHVIWEAGYRQARAEGKGDAEAIKEADAKLRRGAPSNVAAEQPAILRDKRGFGLLMVFYGYFSTRLNQTMRVFDQNSVPKAVGRTLAALVVTGALSELLSGRGPEDDEEPEEWLLRKTGSQVFTLLPFGGEVAGGVESIVLKKRMQERAAPATATVTRFLKAVNKVATKDGEEAAWAALEIALVAMKLPASQPLRTAKYLEDVASGEAEVQDPFDAAGGVIYGQRENQPANPASLASEALSY